MTGRAWLSRPSGGPRKREEGGGGGRKRKRRKRRRPGRSAALEPEGAEKEPSGGGEEEEAEEAEEQPLAMSSSDHGDPLAAAELDPSQALQEEEPIQEDADRSPGQLPPEEAGHPKSYCQAWLLAPLEDARFLICCTNWY